MVHAETTRVVEAAEEQLGSGYEVDTTEVTDALPPFAEETQPELTEGFEAEAQCPTCGELLAWHDEFASCSPVASLPSLPSQPSTEVDDFNQEPVAEVEVHSRLLSRLAPGAANAGYAYELGHRVQPTPTLTAEIIWRGQLKERHPATGLVHRINVYRLNDGYWDCYREEELQAA